MGRDAYEELVEATRFVARLAEVDGAIILSEDLCLLGFGGELSAEPIEGFAVFERIDEMRKADRKLDIEQFGMRHRSAMKYVSQAPASRILVVSQDGPITAIWSEQNNVLIKKNAGIQNKKHALDITIRIPGTWP